MNRAEFEKLRDVPDKEINQNIVYRMESPVTLSFDNVAVSNSLGIDLVLNGVIKPGIPQYKFNFHVRGVGPICRVEVNGKIHGTAGRTHKHDLQMESCPRMNLPHAVARPDLAAMTVEEVWATICRQAHIKHLGKLLY